MNNTNIDLLTRLRALENQLSPSESRIAEVIRATPQQVSEDSSVDLAKKCQVSQSTVIKFCQKLGYKGYPELKLKLSAELGVQYDHQAVHQNIFRDDSLSAVAKKLYDSKVAALTDTLKVNNSETVFEAVEKLAAADRILIVGVGASALVAQDFGWKLSKFGCSVVISGDSHIQLANVTSLTEKDLLLVISYSGKTKEAQIATSFAQKQQVPVITLTGYGDNPLVELGGINLFCMAKENTVRSSSIATRTAQYAITDLLYVVLTQRISESARHIEQSSKIIAALRG